MSIRSRIRDYAVRADRAIGRFLDTPVGATVFAFTLAPLAVFAIILALIAVPIAATTGFTLGELFWPFAGCAWLIGNGIALCFCIDEVWPR